jgi:hypothetical protein
MRRMNLSSYAVLVLCAGLPALASCGPSESDLRANLETQFPYLDITRLRFSHEIYAVPSDKSPRYRVDFEGSAKLKIDLIGSLRSDELQQACGLAAPANPDLGGKDLYIKKASKGEEIKISGDTAMQRDDAGQWRSGAHLMNYHTRDGAPLYAFQRRAEFDAHVIIGEASGEALCARLKQAQQ